MVSEFVPYLEFVNVLQVRNFFTIDNVPRRIESLGRLLSSTRRFCFCFFFLPLETSHHHEKTFPTTWLSAFMTNVVKNITNRENVIDSENTTDSEKVADPSRHGTLAQTIESKKKSGMLA
jgi:hypothetical protein